MFINGTAYAGKSTMVALLAKRYNLIPYGENYHFRMTSQIATPDTFPNICYFETMKNWEEYLNRSPEEFEAWINRTNEEIAQFEIAELIQLSQHQKVIVDTNIPIDILLQIADYHQVAIMLTAQSMSVDHFFDRDDEDKKFLKAQIMKSKNPEKTMANFLACITNINSEKYYNHYLHSGFFTVIRENVKNTSTEQTLQRLAKHFKLI